MRESIRLFFEKLGFTRSEVQVIRLLALATVIGAWVPTFRGWLMPTEADLTELKRDAFQEYLTVMDSLSPADTIVSEAVWHRRSKHIEALVASGQTDSAVARVERYEDGPVLRVNINTAGIEELASLPKIGPKLAERIVDHRNEHGPFVTAEQLTHVKGIGRKMLEKIKPYITIH